MDQKNPLEGYDFYIRGIAFGLRYANDLNLTAYDITNQQARLLGEINARLANDSEISRKVFSEAMGLSGPSVTSLLNGLEKNGFIVRQPGDDDGRTIRISMTDKARYLINETETIFAETERKLLQNFTPEQKETLLQLLKKAYDNIGTNWRQP